MKKKTIVWSMDWENANPHYWENKRDSFQDALVHLLGIWDVHVVTLHPGRRDTAKIADVSYHYCRDIKEIAAKVEKLKPALINYWGFDRPVSRLLDERCPEPHKTVYFVGGALEGVVSELGQVSRVYLSTAADRDTLAGHEHGRCYPRRQMIVCPFTTAAGFCPKDYDDPAERYDVIYVSDWRRGKRQHLLLEALTDVPFRRAAILGARQDRVYFDEHAQLASQTYGSGGYVELIDRVPACAVADFYREAKVAVHLSESEGGSRVLTEVMACGVPVIVTADCASNRDRVVDGQTGVIAEPNARSIGAKITELLADDKLRRTIGEQAAEAMRVQQEQASMSRIFEREFRQILCEV